MSASERLPALVSEKVSDRAKKTLDVVEKFVNEECLPADVVYKAQLGEGDQRWTVPPIIEDLKKKAQKLGLWNMFLGKDYAQGAGFSNVEYGLMAEHLGKSILASEATNNAAPDTGNMELLAKYATKEQKDKWLAPLLRGEIRSCYVMTEPDVASSDATNIKLEIKREGNEYVLNGQKWWISGAGDPRCSLYIVFGKSNPNAADRLGKHSIVLVPANTKGITITRMLSVYGYDEAPHGHAHLIFDNVRVPAENIILGQDRGFEVMVGRMGPGRIHHAMRCIGAAERALDHMISRINDPRKKPFGQPLSSQGVMLEWIAKSRIEIDAARFVVLNAAAKIDRSGSKSALIEIAEAKILVPQMALTVIDRAVQSFGAAGVCQDTPLAYLWASTRTIRLADGPDEAHLNQLGRKENKRAAEVVDRLRRQEEKTAALFQQYGTQQSKITPRL